MPSRAPAIAICAAAVSLVVAAFWAAGAQGERAQSGNLIASLRGEIRPHFLPRLRAVPISVSIGSDFSTADGSRLPQLRRIAIEVGNRGKLNRAGLPVCPMARIRVTNWRQARRECGPALVGHGHLTAEVAVGGQRPFDINGQVLAFNGRMPDGRVAVLADVHSAAPPVSFTMPFVLGADGDNTVLTAKLPETGTWAHVTHFDLTLKRQYRYRGESHSYLTGRCAVPKGFTALVFPLAQATYSFAGGHSVTATATRGCSVRK